LGFEVYNSLAY